VQAGSGQGMLCALSVHRVVVVEESVADGIAGVLRWVEGGRERGRLFGARLSSASRFKLHREAVGRGRCPSQKGSGAEAVCLEW
jgi:hypothetical protein